LGAAEVRRNPVEDPAAQSRTERAVGLPLRDFLLHDGVGVLANEREVVALDRHEIAEDICRVAGVTLIDVDDVQRKANGRFLLELPEKVEKGVTVLTSAHRDE